MHDLQAEEVVAWTYYRSLFTRGIYDDRLEGAVDCHLRALAAVVEAGLRPVDDMPDDWKRRLSDQLAKRRCVLA